MANDKPTAERWPNWITAVLLATLVAIIFIGLAASRVDTKPLKSAPWMWYAIMALIALFILVAGFGVTGRFWSGFMIDARNKMTLSRLQLILWTVLVLSAYLTVVLARLKGQGAAALSIGIPAELWALMGISTASLVGSPLILTNKKQQTPDTTQLEHTIEMQAAQQGVEKDVVKSNQGNIGTVVYNNSPSRARFSDLFRGDETGNAAYLDLGKIQMMLFTVVIVLGYAFTLAAEFPKLLAAGANFPALDQGIIALLGISHAGYLANKAVPASQGAGGDG